MRGIPKNAAAEPRTTSTGAAIVRPMAGMRPWLLATSGTLLLVTATASAGCGDEETESEATTTTPSSTSSSTSTTSSSSSSSSTTSSTGGQGGSANGWYGDLPTLNNDPICVDWGSVDPDPGEDGHLYGVRLTPPSYPFVVTEVQYELWGEGECNNSFAHRVEVFVDTGTSPPATPTDPLVIDVDGIAASAVPIRVVRAALPSPITLQQDDQLFVAVELPNVASSCIAMCSPQALADRDYWSGATAAPYTWEAITTFGIDASARIGANGAPE